MLTSISCITLEIKLIGASRRSNKLVSLDGIYPRGPSAALFRIWPASIRLQNPRQTKDPRSSLNVDERDLTTHEERAVRVRCNYQFVESSPKLLDILHLLLLILLLKSSIECGNNITVNLKPVSNAVEPRSVENLVHGLPIVGNERAAWHRLEGVECPYSDPQATAICVSTSCTRGIPKKHLLHIP